MKQMFLFGDVADNFELTSIPFVEAAGGPSAKIALLLMGGSEWEKYVSRYRDPWIRLGAAEVIPIVPIEDSTELSAEAISCLRNCSGIFIGGGDTRKYHRIYACTEVRAIIRELYQSSVPFGGVSAGALISTGACTISGGKVITPINEYFIGAKSYFDPTEDGDVQLTVGEGLGLLQDCVIEVHFSETGRFPRLVSAMELTKSTYGFGIDEPICLEIREGKFVRVYGRGRAYALKRTRSLRFEVQILEPGDEFERRSLASNTGLAAHFVHPNRLRPGAGPTT